MPKKSDDKPTNPAPGPYFYQAGENGCDNLWEIISQPTQETIAYISYWHCDDYPEQNAKYEANARLLSAAPDMFDALRKVVAAFDRLEITATDGPLFEALRHARHAVAVADGTLSYRAC